MESRACPDCGAQTPVLDGYVTWCGACGWNLRPAPRDRPRTRVDAVYEAVGRRLGDRMARQLLSAKRLEPQLTPSKLAAYVLAVCVHLLALALVVGGVAFPVLTFPNPFAFILGIAMVLTGFLMRPRFGKLPDSGIVSREQAPALHGLVDEVAGALDTRSIDLLVVDEDYNASWSVRGVRRKRVLTLGLPLMLALDPQERVALISHELAHERNGDSTRGFVVGTAINGLAQLYNVLAPGWGGSVRDSALATLEPVVNGVLWLISRPPLGLFYLQLFLVLRDSQRAEYLADALAAQAAGTDAAVGLQEKLLLATTAEMVIRRSVHSKPGAGELVAGLRGALEAVPAHERDRRRRVARLEESRLDATHPPTGLRIRMLEERPRREPRVVLDAERAEAVDRDLAAVAGPIEHRLHDDARDALYYG